MERYGVCGMQEMIEPLINQGLHQKGCGHCSVISVPMVQT